LDDSETRKDDTVTDDKDTNRTLSKQRCSLKHDEYQEEWCDMDGKLHTHTNVYLKLRCLYLKCGENDGGD
jgi:hypothetical protein